MADAELERTRKLMKSEGCGVADMRSQWLKKGNTSESAPKSNEKKVIVDIDTNMNDRAATMRDRWRKMEKGVEEAPSQPIGADAPRRKKNDDNFQNVLKRYNPTVEDRSSFSSEGKVVPGGETLESKKQERERLLLENFDDEKKREERKKEREALLKKIEEDRAERARIEAERMKERLEADRKRKEELAKKKKEAENRALLPMGVNVEVKKNYVIPQRSHDKVNSIIKAKEEAGKTKAELVVEKKTTLKKRIPPLDIEGLTYEELLEKAEELHDLIYQLELDKYDLQQHYERQEYDIMELKERAKQLQPEREQLASPTPRDSISLKTGLGVGKLSEKFSQAPPKVKVTAGTYSLKTGAVDTRSFSDKFKMFEKMGDK